MPLAMRSQTNVPITVFLFAALLLAACGCDLNIPGGANPGDDMDIGQTQILRIEVDPDTVAVGDTARFTCIIADSTDERFKFSWSFSGGPPNGAVTDGPTVLWEAPSEPGMYRHSVTANNGTRDSPANKAFPSSSQKTEAMKMTTKTAPPIALLLAALLLLAAGCDVFGGEDLCAGGDSGLRIQTDRTSYAAGATSMVEVRNCTGESVFISDISGMDHVLQKRVGSEWETAGGSWTLLPGPSKELRSGRKYREGLPVEPSEDRVDSVPGTYRFKLFIRGARSLPDEARLSNTFTVSE